MTEQTLGQGDNPFKYTCASSTTDPGNLVNKVNVTWPAQHLADGTTTDDGTVVGSDLAEGATTVSSGTPTYVDSGVVKDQTVTVTDQFGSGTPTALGTVSGGQAVKVFTYTRNISSTGGTYTNTARWLHDDGTTGGSSQATVTVTNPKIPGALSMGYWQNPNGQALINSDCTGVTNYLEGFKIFADVKGYVDPAVKASNGKGSTATTGTCPATQATAAYVSNVIKTSSASTTTSITPSGGKAVAVNNMLRAQMLAAALDVYFSTQGKAGLPANLGGYTIDVTVVPGGGSSASAFGASSLKISAALGYVDSAVFNGTYTAAQQLLAANVFAAIAQDTGQLFGMVK